MIFAVIFLIGIVAILTIIYIRLIKVTLKSIIKQLETYHYERKVTITLIDKDLIELAKSINSGIEYYQMQMIETQRMEQSLKDSVLNISHDLRTPLTSMLGYLQLMDSTNLMPEQQQNLEIVLTRSNELKQLVSEFYELSLIESMKVEPVFQEIDLLRVFPEYILEFTDELEKQHIHPQILSDHTKVLIMADPFILRRIANNLISNAIKYGQSFLNVHISSDKTIRIMMENDFDGAFIDMEHIFDKFYTGNNGRNIGTGLGLYITKEFVYKLNGTIAASKKDNVFQIQMEFKKEILAQY